MNYRLAFVFSYERLETALICIRQVYADYKHSCFSQKRSFAGTFEYCVLGEIKKFEFFYLAPDSRYLLTTALKSQVLFVFSLLLIITVTTNEIETHKTDRNPPITKQNPNFLNSFK